MEKTKGKITLQFNEQGGLDSVDLGAGRMTEPTHNLYDNPPPGQYIGSMDLGKVYVYKQPDGTFRRCVHFACRLF